MKSTEKGMLEKSFGWVWLMVKRHFYLSQNQTNSRSTWWRRSLCQLHRQPLLLLCRILMVQVYPNHLILQQGFLQRRKVLRLLHLHLRQLPPLPKFLRLLNLHLRQLKPVPKSQRRRGQQLTPLPKTHRNQVWKNLKSLSMMMGPIGRHLNLKDFKGTFLPPKKKFNMIFVFKAMITCGGLPYVICFWCLGGPHLWHVVALSIRLWGCDGSWPPTRRTKWRPHLRSSNCGDQMVDVSWRIFWISSCHGCFVCVGVMACWFY